MNVHIKKPRHGVKPRAVYHPLGRPAASAYLRYLTVFNGYVRNAVKPCLRVGSVYVGRRSGSTAGVVPGTNTQVTFGGKPSYSFSTAVGLFKAVINFALLFMTERFSKLVTGQGIFR